MKFGSPWNSSRLASGGRSSETIARAVSASLAIVVGLITFPTARPKDALAIGSSAELLVEGAKHISVVRYTHALSFIDLDPLARLFYIASCCRARSRSAGIRGESLPRSQGGLPQCQICRDTGGPIRVRNRIICIHPTSQASNARLRDPWSISRIRSPK